MLTKTAQGVQVPEIGLGTYRLYGRECKQTVTEALEIGYRHIDTAQMYKNEKEIGDAIQSSTVDREDIFITTKIWHTNLEYDDVIQSVEDSLKALRTPYVNSLLIHWPNGTVPLQQTFEAMLMLRDQGKALQVGISNFPLSLTKEVIEEYRIPIFTNQVEFHPYLDQLDLLELTYENDFLITAYSPLAQGKVFNDKILQDIGHSYGKTPGQVALRWLIEQENVVAIPKASSRTHLEENLDIYDFELSDENFERIDNLANDTRLVNPTFAPDW